MSYWRKLCLWLAGTLALPLSTLMAQAPRDTVSVNGPTLLAFVIVTPGEIDANPSGDMATVADDFSFYLGTALPKLDSLGIHVFQTIDSVVVLNYADELPRTFDLLGMDTLRVGYWLLGGGKNPEYLGGGVHTSDALIESASKHFGIPVHR